MINKFKQLSQYLDFDYIEVLNLMGNTKVFTQNLNPSNNDSIRNEASLLLDYFNNIEDTNADIQYIGQIDDSINSQIRSNIKNIKSAYFFKININSTTYQFIICSIHENSFNEKDQFLIKTYCENALREKYSSTDTGNDSYSAELFQIIFNSVPEAISFHELPSHKTIMVNNAFVEYTGYSRDEVINHTGNELQLWTKEEDRIKYRNILESKGQVNNFKTEFKIKGGKTGIGLISGKIVSFHNTPHLLLIIRDLTEIDRVQHDLIKSEEKFRNLFNSLPDPVSINKLDSSMAFTDINDAFTEVTQMNKEQLLGKSGFELNLWADPKQRQKYIETIQEFGEITNYQAKIRVKDNKTEEGLISAKTIEINNEPHLLVILKSIDSLIKLKEKLQISEKKFRSIFDSSPDAININKLDKGEFVDINRSFSLITGYSKNDLIGKSISDFNFWYSKEDAENYFSRLNKKGSINNFRTKILLKNGTLIHVLISAIIIKIGGVPHIVNLSRNIEDIVEIQKGLEESENKFRTIVEKSHAAIIIINKKRQLTYANPMALQLMGYSKSKLIGVDFKKLVHPESFKLVNERFKKRQQGQKEIPEQYEFKIIKQNGETRDVEISSSAYIDKNGEPKTISQLLDITERNKAFLNLKKEQTRAQNYLDIAAFMIVSIDKKGIIRLANKKACEILGYEEQELIGKNWFQLCIPKGYINSTKKRLYQFFKNKEENLQIHESIIVSKDGKERSINWHHALIFNEKGEPTELLSSGEDITEKVNSLKIINQTKTVAIIWKYNPNSNIHPISYVSDNIEKLIGYTSKELISNSIKYIDLIHPQDLKRVINEVEEHANEELKPYTHDHYRLQHKNGNWIWIEDQTEFITNENGEITHLSGLLIDVTERIENLKLIQANEERYRTIFSSNLDGMVIFDENGKIVEVNDVVCKMYGYQEEELLNRKKDSNIKIASDLELSYVKKNLENNDSISSESIDERKNGSKFYVSTRLRWINYNNENHILATLRDVSDKKVNEMELLKAKERAEESDQLKSSFLANMSHEIRTPMNAIIGFSSLLEEPELEEDEKLGFISRIKNNSKQLLRLINDIIDISKIEANQVNLVYSKLQINLFMHSIYELFELEAKERGISFSYECHDLDNMKNFYSDSNRLTQIATNLLSNAMKFTPAGGYILFGSYPSVATSEIIFFVKDTGIGIPLSAQEHIFHRFRQAHKMTHKDYGGTGLGLSIVKGLVESMDGRIWVESEEKKGTQFFIALPHQFK